MEQEEVIKIQDFLYRKVRELGSDFVSEADITISMPMWFIELLNYKFINSKLISIKPKVFLWVMRFSIVIVMKFLYLIKTFINIKIQERLRFIN